MTGITGSNLSTRCVFWFKRVIDVCLFRTRLLWTPTLWAALKTRPAETHWNQNTSPRSWRPNKFLPLWSEPHPPFFSSTGNQTQLVRKSSCFSFEWTLNEFNHLKSWTNPVCSFGNQISFIFWKPNESTTIESSIRPHFTTWKPNDFSQTWTRKQGVLSSGNQTSSLITVFWTFTSSETQTELITYSFPASGPEHLPFFCHGNKTSSLPISIHLLKNWASSLKSGPEYILLNVRVSSTRV